MAQTLMRPAGESSKPIPRRFAFARERLAGLAQPAKGRAFVYDTKTPHLAYMLTDKGAASWIWYGRVKGVSRPIKYRLGGGDDLTLESARSMAADITADAMRGINPADTKRKMISDEAVKAAAGRTFGQEFRSFIENYAKREKRSWPEDQRLHDRYLKTLDDVPLQAITDDTIRKLHSEVGRTAKIGANRMLALLSTVFARAIDDNHLKGDNPCRRVKRYKEHSRKRFLTADELPRFMKALEDEPSDTMRDFFKLALWTGARRQNVKSMRWDELNLAEKLWTIPAAKAKAGEELAVHLPGPALKILAGRRRKRSPWVFPSATSASGHLEEPKGAWARLIKRAGLPGVRIHDLRRTLGSWQAKTGASLQVIGKSLGHRSQATTAIYAHLEQDDVSQAVDKAANAMEAAMNPKPPKKLTKRKK